MSIHASTTRAAKISRAAAWLVVAVAVGAVAGWLMNRQSPQPPASAPSGAASTAAKTRTASPTEAFPAAPDDQQLLNQASREDLLAALRKQIANGASTDELAVTLVFLARTRPELALELSALLARDSDEKYLLSAAVLKQWTETDPAAAWNWTLLPDHRRDMSGDPPLPTVVLTRAAAADPKRVVSLVDALMRNSERLTQSDLQLEEVANSGVFALIQTGNLSIARESVERWVADPSHMPLGNGAIEQVASASAASDSPQAAAEWLRTLPVSEARDYAAATFAADWSATAPQAAIEWAAKLEPAEARSQAMQRTFNRWAEKDISTAAAWLGENESDPAADRLIVNLVVESSISSTNPQLAAQWAGLINDPALRLQGLEQTVLHWRNQDPVAAERFVAENKDLSPEDKATLLKAIRTPLPPSRE